MSSSSSKTEDVRIRLAMLARRLGEISAEDRMLFLGIAEESTIGFLGEMLERLWGLD